MKPALFYKSVWTEVICFDLFLLWSSYLFLTGGTHLISGDWRLVIEQKPWIHRLVLTVGPVLALLWHSGRSAGMEKGKTYPSFLLQGISSLGLSGFQWTMILFAVLSMTWTVSSCLRHEVFHTSFDMAIFVQAIWNTLHGAFLYSSIKGGICILADHFSPILAVLALPYALWPDPKFLLLLQAAAVASSVFPIFFLAKEQWRQDSLAVLFVIAFALYLPVRNAVRFDFHAELLATPALLWVFIWLGKGKTFLSSLGLAFALLTKENAACVTFAMGFYGFFFTSRKKWGVGWMIFSIFYFFLVIRLIPILFHREYFYLNANFGFWRSEGLHALWNHLFQPSTVIYPFKIFAPLGFLSLLDPRSFLLTLPMLAQNLLSRNNLTRSIFFQYTAFLTPFVFISAVRGSTKVLSRRGGIYYLIAWVLLMSGVSEYHVIKVHLEKWTPQVKEAAQYLKTIPPEASVRTHEFLASHLAHRRELYIYENEHPREGRSPEAMRAQYVVLHEAWLGGKEKSVVEQLEQTGYRLLHDHAGLKVLVRGES